MKSNPDPSEGTGSKVVGVEEGSVEGLVLLAQGLVRHWTNRHGEVLG